MPRNGWALVCDVELDSLFWYLSQGTSSAPAAATLSAVTSGDLDLFTEQAAKSEEVAKKQLSKDSILSLYGAGAIQQQGAPGNSSKPAFSAAVVVLECQWCFFLFVLCNECFCCCSLHNYKTDMKEALGNRKHIQDAQNFIHLRLTAWCHIT